MIETGRLLLRRWRADDIEPFFAMGQDAEVMRYLGPPTTRDDCEAVVVRQNALADETGSCFWAIERLSDGEFLGFCGIKPGPAGTPVADQPEIGWRLARAGWGQGYAREAAQASLDRAWATTDWPAIAAITVPANERSWGLMIRLGMVRDPQGDFDHPSLAVGDPLRRHLTYRISRPTPIV
ncbi:GNAT family N-acetyltransferase [uncultured Sphingomonas sp.]|uniref:GNAT family N-acetyltransferase n=1 Tax=uncultured Sphingomonas sp. TaxID=158754 RepID=UPI00262F7882|nr:GNAT family N-acetyltransferase [uncultured Sphingomonas sp.]